MSNMSLRQLYDSTRDDNARLRKQNVRLRAACESILEQLNERYDRSDDSPTAWMGGFIKHINLALNAK